MDRQRASIDGLESSKQLMGRQGVPIKDGNLDLYLAGFTLDQQRQAGDSSGRATSVGGKTE